MRALLILILPLLAACSGSLPVQTDNEGAPARPLFQARAFTFCVADGTSRQCETPSSGLSAQGLGGLFLPLAAEVETIRFGSEKARLSLVVNDIAARCTRGSIDWSVGPREVKIGRIFCNWLVIGNVVANLRLTVDWVESVDRFGGRYTIGFGGTGNGSGSGYYVAETTGESVSPQE